MNRMDATVVIIEYKFDHIVVPEYKWVCVASINPIYLINF